MGQRQYAWTVPVSSTYDGFLREVRERVARRVASRTLGPHGQPIHREIALTDGNQSLMDTYLELVARGMQRATIRACFHTSAGGRVERITFAPPPVISLEPTTITGAPRRPSRPTPGPTPRPTPRPAPPGVRPTRGAESEGEVAGVPGIFSGGRLFYGIHTTRHNTMCYGQYDNDTDVCGGVETENSMAHRLHFDQGMRDYRYLVSHLGTETVTTDSYQTRLSIFSRRVNAGRSETARLADRLYREGAREEHRRMRATHPDLPNLS